MSADGDPQRRLRVTVTDGRGRRVPAGGLAAWLARVAPARTRGEVAVALVADARVRALNRQFRGIDRVTDVLAFPSGGGRLPTARGQEPLLGDIVIATGLARRQARDYGHSEAAERRTLALHGLLHLLGYDHEGDSGRMARLEARLRRRGGLSAGLIERERRP